MVDVTPATPSVVTIRLKGYPPHEAQWATALGVLEANMAKNRPAVKYRVHREHLEADDTIMVWAERVDVRS